MPQGPLLGGQGGKNTPQLRGMTMGIQQKSGTALYLRTCAPEQGSMEHGSTGAPERRRTGAREHGSTEQKACLPVQHEDTSSCWTRRRVFLCNDQTCFLLSKKTRLFFEHEDMSSCWTRRHVFAFSKKTWLPVQQKDLSSCSTGGWDELVAQFARRAAKIGNLPHFRPGGCIWFAMRAFTGGC